MSSKGKSKLDLQLGDGVFSAHGEIDGVLRLSPTQRCQRLSASCCWEVRAPDGQLVERGEPSTSHELSIAATGEQEFSFPAPTGPFSYSGESFELRWAVIARAKLAAGKVVTATAPFVLAPETAPEPRPRRTGAGPYRQAKAQCDDLVAAVDLGPTQGFRPEKPELLTSRWQDRRLVDLAAAGFLTALLFTAYPVWGSPLIAVGSLRWWLA